jgi:UDPglucose--hexose-1-phosphate uridylyltransferase
MRSEIRRDYIQNKYVIIAPKRGQRPNMVYPGDIEFAKRICPFCSSNIKRDKKLLSVHVKRDQITVILNKFPAISLDNPEAYGAQEVVIETKNHEKSLEDLLVSQIARLFEVYSLRTQKISKNKKIEYILIFKNSGGAAGASLVHPHSQIFATSFLPPHIFDKSQRTQEYKLKHGSCVYCDVIKKEGRGPRLVWQDRHIAAFCPWASMHNYEIWIMPKRHLDNVTNLNGKERLSFAKILKKILRKIRLLGLPYNFYFHQVIHDEDQHLYMKIVPRGSVWAGVEIGSGVIINPVSPEEAAKYYRRGLNKK